MSRIFCMLLVLLFYIFDCEAQSSGGFPPYKISRLFQFVVSENFILDTNVFKVDNSQDPEDSYLFSHEFQISHNDQRPWYGYGFVYGANFRNFLNFSEYDDSGHSLSANFSIVRKNWDWNISDGFTASSDPPSVEFSGMIRSYANRIASTSNFKLTKYISLNNVSQVNTYRYPNMEYLNTEGIRSDWQLGYHFSRQVWISAGYNYEIQWRNNAPKRNNYSIPMQVNFELRDKGNQNAELVEWFRYLSFSIGYSFSDNSFENPIHFSIKAGGDIPPRTTWHLEGTRNMEFSVFSGEVTYTTRIDFRIQHSYSRKLSLSFETSYERVEYEIIPSHNGLSFSFGGRYSITPWLALQCSYMLTRRWGQADEAYIFHRVSVGTSVYF